MANAASGRYGAERSTFTLATGLVARGWDVEVVVPDRGPLVDELTRAGVKVSVFETCVIRRVAGVRGFLRLVVHLPVAVARLVVRARRSDVVHLNSSVVIGVPLAAFLARRPLVLHLRESFADHPLLWRGYGRLLRPIVRAVIAVSRDTAEEAAKAGLGDRTRVVHNAEALRPLQPGRVERHGVVSVGRINDWKGYDVLLESIGILKQRGVRAELAIAGDVYPGGERYRDRLLLQIRRDGLSDRVRLLGFVDDVTELLDRAAIFVLPSRRPEPFGLALLEALAQGVACVASDAGGPRDLIRPDETGLLVPPGDPGALADALERLLRSSTLRERLGQAAAVDVRRRFSVEQLLDEVEAVYGSVMGCG
jgi:glycosyltransferase involved in cell wall biosynthesis